MSCESLKLLTRCSNIIKDALTMSTHPSTLFGWWRSIIIPIYYTNTQLNNRNKIYSKIHLPSGPNQKKQIIRIMNGEQALNTLS